MVVVVVVVVVVPSGCLVARVFLLPLPIGMACFCVFFASRARFCWMGWGGVVTMILRHRWVGVAAEV